MTIFINLFSLYLSLFCQIFLRIFLRILIFKSAKNPDFMGISGHLLPVENLPKIAQKTQFLEKALFFLRISYDLF